MTRVKGRWKADSRDYVVLDPIRPHPPYRSFASVAIIGNGSSVGVLCFDSMNEFAFDPPEIQRFLVAIARRVASAVLIYQQLSEPPVTAGGTSG
jgi:GAF domain-containing protein